MKNQTYFCRTLLISAVLPTLTASLMAEDSGINIRIPNPLPHIAKRVNQVGNFFIRTSKKLEGADDSAGNRDDGSSVRSQPKPKKRTPPATAPDSQADSKHRDAPSSSPTRYDEAGRSDSSPSTPSSRPEAPASPGSGLSGTTLYYDPAAKKTTEPANPPNTTPDTGNPAPIATTPPADAQPVAADDAAKPESPPKLQFARPVPGRRGLVYLPGKKDAPENMLDVSGIAPGTKVRDPVSQIIFLVP